MSDEPVIGTVTGKAVDPKTWMSDYYDDFKDLFLFQMVLPGSHDSGMSVPMYREESKTTFGYRPTTVTQRLPIYQQLEMGIRVLDVRPYVRNGILVNGHCTKIDFIDKIPNNGTGPWQGACGETIASVVEAVNRFTSKYNELVVVQISDWSGFDGDQDFKDFTADQWHNLWTSLRGLNHLFVTAEKTKIIRDDKLSTYLAKGKPSVMVVVDQWRGVDFMAEIHGQGFFKGSQWFPKATQFWYSEEMSQAEYIAYTIKCMGQEILPGEHNWDYPLIDRAAAAFGNKQPNSQPQLREGKPARIPFDLFLPACVYWADGIQSPELMGLCFQRTLLMAKYLKEYNYAK